MVNKEIKRKKKIQCFVFKRGLPFLSLFSLFWGAVFSSGISTLQPKISFSLCSAALCVTEFLRFLCLKVPLFCFCSWRIFVLNIQFCSDSSSFPFSTLEILFSLPSMVSERNSAIKLYYIHNMYVMYIFFSGYFRDILFIFGF